jgi:CBS domain-containing protein
MGNVCNILASKGSYIFSITPGETVYRGLEIMFEKNVNALLVIDDNQLLGIFTEKDYARKVILKGKASKDTRIVEVMTNKLITVTPATSIEECMRLMTDHFIRHLPVIENDKIAGIISIGDVVKFIIDEQKFIIQHLEHYITGT